jgi:aminoglycoside phosphotransferase
MNQDVSYWLAEVQSLQKQLATAYEERESAHAAATSWRQRYETEARQRRSDAELAQAAIAKLQQEIQYLRGLDAPDLSEPDASALELNPPLNLLNPAELDGLSVTELRHQLQGLQRERDRLIAALQQERERHQQTRESLTLALGDAVDQLSEFKGAQGESMPPSVAQVSHDSPLQK